MKLIIVSTFWNSEKYVASCINSIKQQFYTNYISYFIDDMSTDKSYEVAKNAIGDDDRFILIKNTEKKYKAKNFIDTIRHNPNIEWDDVIVEIDGDDKLSNSHVLGLINKTYMNPDIWICGSRWTDKKGKSMKYGKANPDKARSTPWNFSHMRTYRSFLFRKIKDEHLKFEGEYLKAAVDLGIGIPMLEMAGNEHYHYLDEITYIYTWHENQTYTNNNSFGDGKLQGRTAKYIYSLPVYEKVKLVDLGFKQQENEINKEGELRITSSELLQKVLGDINDTPINPNKEIKSNVNYDLVNQIINNPKIYTPVNEKPIRQHQPKNRNELNQIKKDGVVGQAKKMKTPKQKPNNMLPNVFGGRKKF
jgi:glycosyltransferase involved in cell wall biosynthesis